MWLCFNDGFLSAVADKNDPAMLMVRARRKKDLLNVFGDHVEIIKTAGADYRWRTFVDRKVFAGLVAARIENINYPNFKNSVDENDLHAAYMKFWSLHHHYQQQDPTERTPGTTKTR